jgi:hypothetical protein
VSDFFAGGDRTMTAQVPLGRIPTLYAKTGDLFAWLCLAGLAIILGVAASGSAKQPLQLNRGISSAGTPLAPAASRQFRHVLAPVRPSPSSSTNSIHVT